MWIVRNRNGELELWKNKPYKDSYDWTSVNTYPLCEIYDKKFQEIKQDDEPVEVELVEKGK